MPNFAALTLESLIKTKLPPLPGSVLKILQMLQDVNVSQKALADAISVDPMLASRILRLANSLVYSPRRPVTNVAGAVNMVGNRSIYDIVILNTASDAFANQIKGSFIGRDIWFHSLATAFASADICALANMRGAEEAFVCGLLHDVGKLLLLKADSAFYESVIERSREAGDLIDVERSVFGFDHAKLGAAAAEAWHFPKPVCDIILTHHDPSRLPYGMVMTRMIKIADTLTYRKNEKLDIEELLMSEEVSAFGFKAEHLDTIWDNVVVRLREVMRTFF